MSGTFETTFDGEKVTMRLAPMSKADVEIMSSRFANSRKTYPQLPAPGELELYIAIVSKYVEDFWGLNADDGSPVTLKEVFEIKYFEKLAFDITSIIIQSGLQSGSRH